MPDVIPKIKNDDKYRGILAVLDFATAPLPLIPGAQAVQRYVFNESTILKSVFGGARDAAGLMNNGMFTIDIRFANNKVFTTSPIIASAIFGVNGEAMPFELPKAFEFQNAGDSIQVNVVNIGAANIAAIYVGFLGGYDVTQGAG